MPTTILMIITKKMPMTLRNNTNIPVSVIVVTRNEEARIEACLDALQGFQDIWIVDSNSTDKTCKIARTHGAKVIDFSWNEHYPKKRQWCLDTLDLAHNFVFFVDADEIVTPDLILEIAALDFTAAGYFIKGRYLWPNTRSKNGRVKILRFGICNQKLALIDRRKIEFPVIDDLDIPGMGEIEGHYQPVLKPAYPHETISALNNHLLHNAHDNPQQWESRHRRYAAWEAGMNAKSAWPRDPVGWRQNLKAIFRQMPYRASVAFLHSYILKWGFLDGAAGFAFAQSRARYYTMITAASKTNMRQGKPAETLD